MRLRLNGWNMIIMSKLIIDGNGRSVFAIVLLYIFTYSGSTSCVAKLPTYLVAHFFYLIFTGAGVVEIR